MRPRGIPRRQAHEGARGPEQQGDLAVIPLLKDVFGRNQAGWGGTGREVATFRRSRGRRPTCPALVLEVGGLRIKDLGLSRDGSGRESPSVIYLHHLPPTPP